jgi:hypothetical protein
VNTFEIGPDRLQLLEFLGKNCTDDEIAPTEVDKGLYGNGHPLKERRLYEHDI